MIPLEPTGPAPLRATSDDPDKPGNDRQDHDVDRRDREEGDLDRFPFPDPSSDRGGWERSDNQEIYGDERGGQDPQRP